MAGQKKTPKRSTTRTIDWSAAEQWYLDDATRSYQDVADHFGVTKKTVSRHASTSDPTWSERRQNVSEIQVDAFVTAKQAELQETDDRHLKLYKSIQSAGINALHKINEANTAASKKGSKGKVVIDAKGIAAAARTIKEGIEGERVILGLPILISRSENAITDYTPPTVGQSAKTLDKLMARKKKLDALRNRK